MNISPNLLPQVPNVANDWLNASCVKIPSLPALPATPDVKITRAESVSTTNVSTKTPIIAMLP